MKYNLFDLTGREQYCCAQESSEKDIAVPDPQPLRPLLIIPKETSNKSPYLQNPENPHIEDFITPEGGFNYDNSVFLSDILADKLDKKKSSFLEDFFQAQLNCLNEFDKINESIILVPDHYDAEKQERILRACQMSRNKTFLLWRSIAICLGAEDYFQTGLLQDGARVAVIDGQVSGCVNYSVLTMKEITRNGSIWLVPARHAYRKKEYFSREQGSPTDPFDGWKASNAFWRHTWQNDGDYLVPDNGAWYIDSFQKPTYICYTSCSRLLYDVDLIIVSGKVAINGCPMQIPIIKEKDDENFALVGAGRFAVRKNHHLPTYFDECEALYFIAQNPYASEDEKRVFYHELIPNSFCEGGSRLTGSVNTAFELSKGSDKIRFLLHVGTIDNNTQLKELIQTFPRQSNDVQPLKLHPSMIPGQGIANVRVEARPLLFSDIELDFLKMEDAFDVDKSGRRHRTTIDYLKKTMPLCYPVDLPGVKARGSLWNNNEVNSLFNDYWVNHTDVFAKSRWPNINADGIERFERVNVFGNVEGYEYPHLDIDLINRVFERIQFLYESNTNNHYARIDAIRLAAWTYRCGLSFFQCIIRNTLDKIKSKSNGNNVTIYPQEFTVCANMLSINEKQLFLESFNRHIFNQLCDTHENLYAIKGISHWIRALQGILIDPDTFGNNSSIEDSTVCETCMQNLLQVLENALKFHTIQLIRGALCCMLLLLRRRKADRYFISQDSALFHNIFQCMQRPMLFNNKLASVFLEFLSSKGSIEGLAEVAKEFKENG